MNVFCAFALRKVSLTPVEVERAEVSPAVNRSKVGERCRAVFGIG